MNQFKTDWLYTSMIELYIIMNHYDDDEYFETIDEESYGCVCMCVGGGDGGLACRVPQDPPRRVWSWNKEVIGVTLQ